MCPDVSRRGETPRTRWIIPVENSMRILISGALAGKKNVAGVKAVLVALDTESGKLETIYEYLPPTRLDCKQKVQFTGYTFDGTFF
jgi:hypothetical protein